MGMSRKRHTYHQLCGNTSGIRAYDMQPLLRLESDFDDWLH